MVIFVYSKYEKNPENILEKLEKEKRIFVKKRLKRHTTGHCTCSSIYGKCLAGQYLEGEISTNEFLKMIKILKS